MKYRLQMSAEEVRSAIRVLGVDQTELAEEWDITPRIVRRWCDGGCTSGPAIGAFHACLRLHAMGLPWQRAAVSIRFGAGGIIAVSDRQAVIHDAALGRQL